MTRAAVARPNKPEQVRHAGRNEVSWLSLVIALALPVVMGALFLALPASHRSECADSRGQQLAEAEKWLAVSLLALLALMAGIVGWVVLRLRRRLHKPDPTLAFLDDLYLAARQEHEPKPTASEPGEMPAWEKASDWWRA